MNGAEILLQPGVFPRLLQGLWVTVWIAGVSVALSVPVGLIVGWLMTMNNPVIRLLTRIYLDFIRIMPQLALLFIAFYGFARAWNWNLDATGACVFVFVLWGGAELGDLVRGALESIPDAQYESAYVLGLGPWQTFTRVILPQALRRLLPASMNLATRIVKTTSLAVLLGVVEVIKVGQQIIDANRFQYPTGTLGIYRVIFFMYFIVCWPLSIVARRQAGAERYFLRGTARQGVRDRRTFRFRQVDAVAHHRGTRADPGRYHIAQWRGHRNRQAGHRIRGSQQAQQ